MRPVFARRLARDGRYGGLVLGLLTATLVACGSQKPAEDAASVKPEAAESADDSARSKRLEQENARLREELASLKASLSRPGENAAPGASESAKVAAVQVGAEEQSGLTQAAPTSSAPAVSSEAEQRDLPVVRLTPGAVAAVPVEAVGKRPVLRAAGKRHSVENLEAEPADGGPPPLVITGDAAAPDFDAAVEAFEAGNRTEAVQRLTRFLRANPSHPFTDSALFLRGEARRELGQLHAAEIDLRAVLERFPDESAAADALFSLAEIQLARGDEAGAKRVYAELLSAHADSSAASRIPERYLP